MTCMHIFFCSEIKRIDHGYNAFKNPCIIVSFHPRKIKKNIDSYKEAIKSEIIKKTSCKDVESDPQWLQVKVDYLVFEELNGPLLPSGNVITDVTGSGGTITMIVKIESPQKQIHYYGLSCCHVPFPSRVHVSSEPNSDCRYCISQRDDYLDMRCALLMDKVNVCTCHEPNGDYCLSHIRRELLKDVCKCPQMLHELSLFPITGESHLNKFALYQYTSANNLCLNESKVGHVASVLYGNLTSENESKELQLSEPKYNSGKHEDIFASENNADFVAFSVNNSFDFIEGKTYEFTDKHVKFENVETGSSRFIIENLNLNQNIEDSLDKTYYTFNYRSRQNLKALADCGMLYIPDKAYEKCVRSVGMKEATMRQDGSIEINTAKSDVKKNGRLFGTTGDSGSYVYYIRKKDRACVVVGYLARAHSIHSKCKNVDCISEPFECFDKRHNECNSIHCKQHLMFCCTSKDKRMCPLMNRCKPGNEEDTCKALRHKGHSECHLHCDNCNFEDTWTSVVVLPLCEALRLLIRNLCMLNSGTLTKDLIRKKEREIINRIRKKEREKDRDVINHILGKRKGEGKTGGEEDGGGEGEGEGEKRGKEGERREEKEEVKGVGYEEESQGEGERREKVGKRGEDEGKEVEVAIGDKEGGEEKGERGVGEGRESIIDQSILAQVDFSCSRFKCTPYFFDPFGADVERYI